MRLHLSPVVRFGRALTALVTIWCLGCSGFEPVLDALLGARTGSAMACASQAGMTEDMATMDGSQTGDQSVSGMPMTGDRFGCGCGVSCQAPSLASQPLTLRPDLTPQIRAMDLGEPTSLVRTPLIPPPKRVTA